MSVKPQFLAKMLLIVIVASLAVVNARPHSHLEDLNQADHFSQQDLDQFLDKLNIPPMGILARSIFDNEIGQGPDQSYPYPDHEPVYFPCQFNPVTCYGK